MRMCPEYENSHFSHIFFQHGYLTHYSTYLPKDLYVQFFDKGLSFCFIVYRRWKLEKKYKKSQKLPVFCDKIKTKA